VEYPLAVVGRQLVPTDTADSVSAALRQVLGGRLVRHGRTQLVSRPQPPGVRKEIAADRDGTCLGL